MSNNPKISVVMTAYNHEKFIRMAVDSVLNQTFKDFELVIVNDGSKDKTDEIIKGYSDPRIVYICQDNAGPSLAFNAGVLKAKGDFIAFMSGDDYCEQNRLQEQLAFCQKEKEPIILFSNVRFIDADNKFINPSWLSSFFNVSLDGNGAIVRRFFLEGNFLSAPSAFLPRDILIDEGLMDPCLFQLQDFDLWIRLVKKYKFSMIEKQLVRYRVHDESLSSPSPSADNVMMLESFLIYRKFFDKIPEALFRSAFSNLIIKKGELGNLQLQVEQAFLLLKHHNYAYRCIGVEMMHKILSTSEGRDICYSEYDYGIFNLRKFFKQATLFNTHEHSLELEYQELKKQYDFVAAQYNRRLHKVISYFLFFIERKMPRTARVLVSIGNIFVKFWKIDYKQKFNCILIKYLEKVFSERTCLVIYVKLSKLNHYQTDFFCRTAFMYFKLGDYDKSYESYVRAFLINKDSIRPYRSQLVKLIEKNKNSFEAELISINLGIKNIHSLEQKGVIHVEQSVKLVEIDSWCKDQKNGKITDLKQSIPFTFDSPTIFEQEKEKTTHTVAVPKSFMAVLNSCEVIASYVVLHGNNLIIYEPAANPKYCDVAGCRHFIRTVDHNNNSALLNYSLTTEKKYAHGVLISGRCSSNYYHWLIEYLPKLCEVNKIPELKNVPIIIDAGMPLQHYQALDALMGSYREPIIFDKDMVISVDKLYIPSTPTLLRDDFESPYWLGGAVSKEHIDFIKEAVLKNMNAQDLVSKNKSKKIYISRFGKVARSAVNEPVIQRIFIKAGFDVVYPQLLSFKEQVSCFYNADVIAGVSGAGLSNIVFCRPGTKIIALTSDRNKDFCIYSNIAKVNGLDFMHVTGPNTRARESFPTQEAFAHSSFCVDTNKIKRVLKRFL